MPSASTSVSLVLGSGGARGLAHLGVIAHLEERGFAIRAIAGSSMGALIGGIYAAGKLDVYERWVTGLTRNDVVRLLDLSFGHGGLFKGERIISVLRELVGESDIESLPVAFTAVATDIDAQKEVWLNRGPLFDAIRASIAYPTLFTPHHYRGRRLLDGGLLNPVPIAPTLSDETDVTIAVDLSGRTEPGPPVLASESEDEPEQEDDSASREVRRGIAQFIDGIQSKLVPDQRTEGGFFDIVTRSMDTMQTSIARCKLAAYSPDFVIEIPRDACGLLEFHRARELIRSGREHAEAALSPAHERIGDGGQVRPRPGTQQR